jgi:SprT protein
MIEHHFQSRSLNWIRYFEETRQLYVQFRAGDYYRYWDVPIWRVHELIVASSAGRYFHRNIAYGYRYARDGDPEPPKQVNSIANAVKERSLANIRDHVPAICLETLRHLFDTFPVLVRVTARRKTKHGDHRPSPCRRYSVITVNASGNAYQFLVTLLHEFAHAETYATFGARVQSHGSEWKSIFSRILLNFLSRGLFPDDLASIIRRHAVNPLYSSAADSELQLALRKHDTLDNRRTVAELPDGQAFSLDGKLVLIKCCRLRTRYKCVTPEGKTFHVSASARVHTIYK